MKKLITILFSAVLVSLFSVTAFAAEFDPSLAVDRSTDGIILVEIADDEQTNEVLAEKKPSLTIDCTWDTAKLLGNGSHTALTVTDGKISFTVTHGGTYIITNQEYSVDKVDASCTMDGKYIYTVAGNTYEELIPAAGHDFRNIHRRTCANCSEPNPDYAPPYIPIVPSYYDITVNYSANGTVTAGGTTATSSTTITLTVDPDFGYELDTLSVTDRYGNSISLTEKADGTYTFRMPAKDVWVDATFKLIVEGECSGDWTCPMYGYTDLDSSLWYHDGIHYCIENDLMEGIGNNQFNPNGTTTRAMIVTILWRLEGSPIVNYAMDFEDVESGKWYTEAIRWAQANGIVEGYDGKFSPNDSITREQMVTIMWRYAKYKGYDVSVGENTNILSYGDAFDVSEYSIPAMQWACGSGMIQGIADGSTMNLVPQGNATRAQSAAILQRYCQNIAKVN